MPRGGSRRPLSDDATSRHIYMTVMYDAVVHICRTSGRQPQTDRQTDRETRHSYADGPVELEYVPAGQAVQLVAPGAGTQGSTGARRLSNHTHRVTGMDAPSNIKDEYTQTNARLRLRARALAPWTLTRARAHSLFEVAELSNRFENQF